MSIKIQKYIDNPAEKCRFYLYKGYSVEKWLHLPNSTLILMESYSEEHLYYQ